MKGISDFISRKGMLTINKTEMLNIMIFLFAFSIPVFPFISVKILIGCLVLSCFIKADWTILLRRSWPEALYLFVIISGLFYSSDLKTGFKVLETNFSFVAIPIVFSRIRVFREGDVSRVIYFFILGLLLSCAICLTNAVMQYHESVDVFFFNQLTQVVNIQPIYFAYYLIFAMTIVTHLLFYQNTKFNNVGVIGILLFLFLMLVLTGGQTAFVSILFVFSFFILKFLVEKRSIVRSITFGIICIMLICLFIISSLEQGARNSVLNDSWERFALWESAMKAIPDIFFGTGTGDDKTVLNTYYLTHGMAQFATDSYNSHNQFLQILFTNGLLGLISIVTLICRPLYLSIKNNHILGVLVFFPFLIYGMTEVFLGRYQGVVLYALLHQIFISYYDSLRLSITPLKMSEIQ